jgi:hypothetical protein
MHRWATCMYVCVYVHEFRPGYIDELYPVQAEGLKAARVRGACIVIDTYIWQRDRATLWRSSYTCGLASSALTAGEAPFGGT